MDLSAAAGLLVGFHQLIAMAGAPEWAMEREEADTFMETAANVLRHYDIRTTQKAIDWGAFAVAAGQTYGVRLIATSLRMRAEKAAGQQQDAPAGAGGWDVMGPAVSATPRSH